jgi:Domain of unknown function (DUF5666)
MSALMSTTRLSRVALLAVTGAAAVSLAACGSSDEAKPAAKNPTGGAATPTSSTPSASGRSKDWVNGLIESVSGSTIQISQRSGTATVDFTPSTAVSETTPAQLTDVAAGSCVSIRPDRNGGSAEGGAISARSVRVSTAVDGKCPAPAHPAGSGSHHQPPGGQVASVSGSTIMLNGTDAQGNPAQTSVNVTSTTTYTKQTATDAHAIVQGKCIAAQGTRNGGSALQATNISVQQADNCSCPEPGGGKHHRH